MNANVIDRANRWLLPAGVEEYLPDEANRLERLRRDLIDMFRCWGYELVIPPLIEYLDSLLVGVGHELELDTFKLVDQETGRMMGVRADMTPQVARIDAHRLKRDIPTRLCYLDAVLHTRQAGFTDSRNPLQLGAEIYGHAGIESDVEILRLMVKALRVAGLDRFHIDIGHVGIFRTLADQAGLSPEQESILFEILQRKAQVELDDFLASVDISARASAMIAALIDLNGGQEVLDRARHLLADAGPDVQIAIDAVEELATACHCQLATITPYFDLAELRGYRYQSGVVFAAFAPGHCHEIARGGRYDEIGRLFGRTRPATGFSADLKTLLALVGSGETAEETFAIMAPSWTDDDALRDLIRQLRGEGERVIYQLPGQQGKAQDMGCDRQIVCEDGQWVVRKLNQP